MYDAVLLCVPDDEKFEIIKYCLENNKHVLVEKPLIFKNKKNYFELDRLIKKIKHFVILVTIIDLNLVF